MIEVRTPAAPVETVTPIKPSRRIFESETHTMDWLEPLVRGCIALSATGLLFAAARLRFRGKEDVGAPADLGLD